MKEDFTGFFHGVKEVLKARDTHLTGIDGAIAELIQVPKQYEVAIETALGATLQHVVVKDEEAGREAIHFLKQRKLGRATFLPKDVLKARQMGSGDLSQLQQSTGFVGMAHDLVDYDEQYKQVIGSLLGHVVVTKDLKDANYLAKKLQYRYRFVTLDGDIVNPGGSMTGGSAKQNQSNLLGREREIEHLAQEMEKAAHTIAEQRKQLSEYKGQLTQLEENLEDLRVKGEEAREKEQSRKEEFSQLLFSKRRLDEKLEVYDQDVASYQSELITSKQKKEEYSTKMEQYQAQSIQVEKEIKELEQAKKDTANTKEEKGQHITQLKVQLARKIQEFEGLKQHVERLEQQKLETDNEWNDVQQHLLRLEGDLGQQDDQEDELDLLIKDKKEEKENVSSSINDLRQKRKAEQQEWERLDIDIRQLRKELRSIEEGTHQEEVKVNRLDVELENYLTLLREEYELSYELAKESYPLEQEYSIVKKEVDDLKRQINLLGTVNLGAIEEFERLEERFLFLKEQEEDLNQAKATLYEVISEMDEEMTKRFKETFDQVRHQFTDVFQQLFGGGRADLLLSDPEDLLHTGVDIVAQPPGKKLQHLALLSGGERALTAIALLFAILRVKPVPFCVLDEVEAALDEANVSRFAQYLREFAKQTQFIVITHRKGTMEGADVLYGITMQESGVSRLVSVKMEEKDKVISA
jgi:chromosome segregation protein